MEWRDECRITAAFEAVMRKQNEQEERIAALEEVVIELLRKGAEE